MQSMLRQVLLVAGSASLVFGLLFLMLYQDQLGREKAAASEQINQVLRISLENAMLKRDVPGLHEIVRHMGQQAGIDQVMILAPSGEVRFASRTDNLGKYFPELIRLERPGIPESQFVALPGRGEVLRSINPVPNQVPCTVCHGPLDTHPVNGMLVVDYHAETIRQEAWRSAALFIIAGITVLTLTLGVLWRLWHKRIMLPLQTLDGAAQELAAGNLGVRVPLSGHDEPGRLAASFNRMADHLVEHIRAAKQQQQYLQELLDGLPDGVRVIRQSDFRILAVNHAYCQQLGISEAQALGSPCYRSSHDRETPCPTTLLVCPVIALDKTGQALKCRHHHRSTLGREFPVEVHAVLVERISPSGIEKLVVESISDLSDVARLSQEQRLSELGLLAAGIAHEIHNPLGSMRLAIDGLLRLIRQDNSEPARMGGYLEMISAEIDRCTGVTQRLLLLSRPPRQQAQIVPIHPAISDTLSLLEFDARSHGITQKFEPCTTEIRVLADDSDLRMLVLNLVQNAHHAMPDGGILTVRTSSEEAWGIIEIRDTGKGIPEEHAQRIFDPFFSQRADSESGTGLGLTICKSIVERYAGTINLSSKLGRGTVFTVHLPRVGNDP